MKEDEEIIKRGAVYGRYSSENQRKESITGQFRDCYKCAESYDIPILYEYYDEAMTGRTANRPEFLKMIQDAKKGLFNYLFVYSTDRFSRNRYDCAVYKHQLKKAGVKIIYAKQHISDGPEGEILEGFLEVLDEYYSKEQSRKFKRGRRETAMQGKWIGGKLPFGIIKKEDGTLAPDPDKAPVIKEIFERYTNGESAVSICKDLNARGYRTIDGNTFNKSSLPHLLRNEKFIGIYRYKYEIEEKGEIILKEHISHFETTITKELFDKANEMMKKNHQTPHKSKTESIDFLLTGKLKCGLDNANMVGDSGTSKSGQKYYYYSCLNRKNKKNCNKKSIKKDFIEYLVVNDAKKTLLKDEIIEFIAEQIVILQEREADTTVLDGLKRQLKETGKALNNILKAIENGIFTDTTKARMQELEKRKKQLDNEIYIEQRRLETPKVKKEHVIYWLQKFKDGDVNDIEYQRKIINSFINEVKVFENKIIISYNYSGQNSQNTLSISNTDMFEFDYNGGAYASQSEHLRMDLENFKIDITNKLIIKTIYLNAHKLIA